MHAAKQQSLWDFWHNNFVKHPASGGMFLFIELAYGVTVSVSFGVSVGVSDGGTGGGDVFVGGAVVDVAVGGNCVTVGVIVGSTVGVGTLSVIVTRRSA